MADACTGTMSKNKKKEKIHARAQSTKFPFKF